jgi:hypothetical protein
VLYGASVSSHNRMNSLRTGFVVNFFESDLVLKSRKPGEGKKNFSA